MAKLSDEKIAEIKEAYKRLGTYAAVAREVGVSASTARKYAMGDVSALSKTAKTKETTPRVVFNGSLANMDDVLWHLSIYNDLGEACKLYKEEEKAVIEFLKEA